jgi:acyl-homoserine-lactone acylase
MTISAHIMIAEQTMILGQSNKVSYIKTSLLVSSVLLLSACSEPAPQATPSISEAPDYRYNTQIRWTSYGIPHVKADDWGSLGYGFAYATAGAAICTIARDVLMVNGDLSSQFGADDGNLSSDIFHRAVLDEAMIQNFRAGQSDRSNEFSAGYIAGYNRYINDNRMDLPEACAGASWVRALTETDVDKLTIGVGIRYGLGRFQREMANAAPPGEAVASLDSDFEIEAGIGSNAVAMGRDVTESGRGLLLGNPHYPWQGSSRFHMIHTTIPGELDVMGVSLYTTSRVAIGFNKDVAWSHTVSTGLRSTLYALELDPADPTRYRYGDDYRDMVRVSIAVPVLNAEGGTSIQEREVYMSHYGPMVVSNQLPWTTERAFAIRDVNLYNDRAADTYDALNRAANIDEVEAALSLHGVSWTNSIAADRDGTAFYADISVVPNVDADLINSCRTAVDGSAGSMIILDGSNPDCEWRNEPGSAIPGAMPPDAMPRIRRTDYVHNANDSYWLSTPRQPLEGYSPIIGAERSRISLRTRAGLSFIEEALATGEKMQPRHLEQMLFSHRHFGAELFLDDVLGLCQNSTSPVMVDGAEVDVSASCAALAAWDRRADINSRGVHVWREFWRQAARIDGLYATPFDAADPVNTPRDLATGNAEVAQALLTALANSQLMFESRGIALDAELGSIQFEARNDERIPIPGGDSGAGMWSVITAQFQQDQGAYSPITHGNSYIQVIGWDADGRVDARAILTYSQSEDPRSAHFADQTRLYSQSQWLRLPFYEEDILADPNLLTLVLNE